MVDLFAACVVALGACIVAGGILQVVVIARVQRRHPEVWVGLGRPRIFALPVPRSTEGHRRLIWTNVPDLAGDAPLQRMIRAVRGAQIAAVVIFLVALLLFFASSTGRPGDESGVAAPVGGSPEGQGPTASEAARNRWFYGGILALVLAETSYGWLLRQMRIHEPGDWRDLGEPTWLELHFHPVQAMRFFGYYWGFGKGRRENASVRRAILLVRIASLPVFVLLLDVLLT